jgi:hypothetical protein
LAEACHNNVIVFANFQPMNTLTSFFNNIRYTWFVIRTEREIYNRIFPHLEQERDYGYPFDSDEEMRKLCQDGEIAALPFVQNIERDIVRMPKAYGEAFRYILYRELKARGTLPRARMKMFRMLARVYIHPEPCDPKFIACRTT